MILACFSTSLSELIELESLLGFESAVVWALCLWEVFLNDFPVPIRARRLARLRASRSKAYILAVTCSFAKSSQRQLIMTYPSLLHKKQLTIFELLGELDLNFIEVSEPAEGRRRWGILYFPPAI